MEKTQIGDGLAQVQAWESEAVMGTYARQPYLFVRGEGARLWDSEGNEYLDFLAGIAVAGVGHANPHVTKAIACQAATLGHISNLYYNPLQGKLAVRLAKATGMEKAFFCNSGAEANECAIKIARKWGKAKRGDECFEIITFHGSFHGRTLATVTATAQPKYQAPFAPLPEGFKYVHVGDVAELDEAISEATCAVMIEPIQGESGIRVVPPDFLQLVRALCDEAEVLLILDEVQCGMGRTGDFLASQGVGVTADIVTLAKSVANGFPMGVCLARGDAANTLVPGDHGSTFGGQPLACAAALATLDVLESGVMTNARVVGQYFLEALQGVATAHPTVIKEVRGSGLMVGVEFAEPVARAVLSELLKKRIVANATGDTVIRFLPPLIVTTEECDQVVGALGEICSGLSSRLA